MQVASPAGVREVHGAQRLQEAGLQGLCRALPCAVFAYMAAAPLAISTARAQCCTIPKGSIW